MINNKIIFSLGNNDDLSKDIAKCLKLKLGKIKVSKFSDGELNLKIEEDCRNKSVFLIQSTSQPDSNFTTLILAIDAARRASAREIIAVIPYFGYSRQERLSLPGVPISTKVFATILETLKVDRIITVDLHSKAIEGFFLNTKVDHLGTIELFTTVLKERFKSEIKKDKLVIVAPDTGAANNARNFSLSLLKHSELAIVSKGREKANTISSMQLVGDVRGKIAVIVDDIADTCGTMIKSANLLKQNGATKVVAVVTHALFSGNSISETEKSPIDEVLISNTLEKNGLPKKVKIISIAKTISKLISKI